MSSIDTQFRVVNVPAQGRSRDEYRLPGSHPAAESNADATGPGADAPALPVVRARADRRFAGKRGRDGNGTLPRPGTDKSPTQPSKHAAPVHITGRIFALRDGSGYAALGSDGHYYRVDGGAGHGLAYARAGGSVDASMVNVTGGPVSAVRLDAADTPAAVGNARGHDAEGLPKSAIADPAPGDAKPDAPLPDAQRAATESRATRRLIAEHPHSAMRSQANVPPYNAISLLR